MRTRLLLFVTALSLVAFLSHAQAATDETSTSRSGGGGTVTVPCPAAQRIPAEQLPPRISLLECPLTGRAITDSGATATVPGPGMRVTAIVEFVQAPPQRLTLERTVDNELIISDVGRESDEGDSIVEGGGGLGGTGPGACSQTASASTIHTKWKKNLAFGFRWHTTPAGLSISSSETDIRNAYSNFPKLFNDCGRTGTTSAVQFYAGRLDIPSRIDVNGGCLGNDNSNMVDFGNLEATTPRAIGYICRYSTSSEIVEADIKIERYRVAWFNGFKVPVGCSGEYSLDSIMTHETGHAWGLNHVSEASYPGMTMSTRIPNCDLSHTTLGLGDMNGMTAKYP